MDFNNIPQKKSTVLIVDDNPDNMTVASNILMPFYHIRVAPSGSRALEILALEEKPDLVLLDVMMPEMDGYQVMQLISSNPATREIPVIFLTAMDSTKDEERGFELGAKDYVTKPIRPSILLARVKTQLEMKQNRDWLKKGNEYLEAEVKRRMQENSFIQDVSIHALARLAETRDDQTGKHLLRTSAYVERLAQLLQSDPRYKSALTDDVITMLKKSAPLHDIGKVGIPDAILLKQGKLNDAEWVIMKTHAELGARAIEMAEKDAGATVGFLTLAKEIAHWHHEKWDGTGYPDGLKWDGIPLSAKLMAIADVFDALISERPYKKAFTFDDAFNIMKSGRGYHFDPILIDAFLNNYDDFKAITQQHRDIPPA